MPNSPLSIMPTFGPRASSNLSISPPVAPNPYQRPLAPPPVPNYNGDPTFQNISSNLNAPINLNTPGGLFDSGMKESNPDIISPETQRILDIIKQNQDYNQKQGIAAAQATAAQRGITGSSTEQFGVQQAVESAARTGQDATANLLNQRLQASDALHQLRATALFQGATTEAGLNYQQKALLSSLTSDEIASLRNMSEADKNRFIQMKLGQLGIDAQNAATNMAEENSQRANNPLNLLINGFGSGLGHLF